MPSREVLKRVARDKREGKAPTTQAGEFIREEIHHIREGKHGARSPQQAIAIGLSKARRAGVELKPPGEEQSASTRRKAGRDYARGHGAPPRSRTTGRRRAATRRALERESQTYASPRALAQQGHSAASRRSPGSRATSARKAVRTKGPARRARAARKAARTRATNAAR